ncbi:ligand-binding protein SH3 [Candidatus Woesearchaeota archaeon CG10_big_fil_rev_8_21_14_0_10_37_12]|nr:MAG: ligand-binding protein SH3 [Candidatus Woesearchaeota archaeon CG10_big_fil_rev_8_21_14_0_10_37_12]
MVNSILWTILLSLTPIGELRVSIPFGIASGLHPLLVFIIAVIANWCVAPILFLFLEIIHYRILHVRHYRTMFDHIMARARRKSSRVVEKYGVIGLALLVAVPLPVTGVYTATLLAWFFGMNKLKALGAIALGASIAGVIMMFVSIGGLKLIGFV